MGNHKIKENLKNIYYLMDKKFNFIVIKKMLEKYYLVLIKLDYKFHVNIFIYLLLAVAKLLAKSL